jgi:enoyl-CoA hydratase/carnithine racemase
MGSPKPAKFDLEVRHRILVVTIRNPPHNYLGSAFFQELSDCRERFESDEVDAVVITGDGASFSKGVDLEELKSNADKLDAEAVLYGNEIYTFISRLRKPVIAAINGACFGGGLELALACHIRVCSDRARFGLPELAAGVIPGLGGITRLVRVVGEAKALELILLSDLIPAARAMELHLVSRVFPRRDFVEKAILFTRTILTARPECIREVLDLVAQSRTLDEGEAIRRAAASFARLAASIAPARSPDTTIADEMPIAEATP